MHADGTAWANADVEAGVVIRRAEGSKDTKYPELLDSPQVKLVTLACEIGGRWSERACHVVRQLAVAKARESPKHLRVAAQCAFEARWWALLSCTQQSALAATLVEDAVALLDGADAHQPELVDVLVDHARDR